MKNKKILILILSLFLFTKNTNAASYDMILETNSLNVEKDSNITIYITLDNINGISNGVNACEAILTNDSNITINSISGINSWTVTQGEKIIFDTTVGTLIKTQIAQIEATVTGKSKVNLTNIICTDGINSYTTSDETIYFEISTPTTTTPTTQESEYSSSSTVESEKTGVLEISFILVIITMLITLITIKLTKKDLFKKI